MLESGRTVRKSQRLSDSGKFNVDGWEDLSPSWPARLPFEPHEPPNVFMQFESNEPHNVFMHLYLVPIHSHDQSKVTPRDCPLHMPYKTGVKECRLRQFMASATTDEVKSKVKRIDSHLHVWASDEEAKEFPFAVGQEPMLPASGAYLVESMSEAGVDGALIIQPINHMFDHTYMSSVLQKYPGKFVGCCLADPTEGGGGVRELERLINKDGYRAVRFNPYLWPSDEQMTNKVGKAMFLKAGELGAVVGFMCFKGLLLHIEDIMELCLEFPSTAVMIDHFGFCKPAKNNEEAKAWKLLLKLARFPQVYVKVSAFFRISREPFPYKDTWPLVQDLLNAFGAKRLLWGSDFPFITAECGYTKANEDLPQLIAESLCVSESELECLLGGTALRLFEGAWQEPLLVA